MREFARASTFDAANREALLVRIERITELPLLILAFVIIPLLVGGVPMASVTDRGGSLYCS